MLDVTRMDSLIVGAHTFCLVTLSLKRINVYKSVWYIYVY